MSLRLRLTLWYVLVLCLGLAAFGGAVFLQTQQAASTSFDKSLRERASELRGYVRYSPNVHLLRSAPDEGAGTPGEAAVWIRVVDMQGRIVATQGPVLNDAPARLLETMSAGFHDVGNVHLYVQRLLLNGRPRAVIQTITSGQELDASSHRLISAMVIVGAFTVVLAALAGLFLANGALRPVDRITRVAREIGEGDLRRRVMPEITQGKNRNRISSRDEIGRLAMTFDEMLARLQEADDRRRQLTADAAHELATPVATIMTGAEIALRKPRTPEAYRESLRHVVEEGRHLGRLVEDLLLLARADAGQLRMKYELVEIDEVCRQATIGMQPLAEKRDVSLELALPKRSVLVEGDEMRLAQVIRNLLDNGLRYTPRGGYVRLVVEQESPNEDGCGDVLVRVEDSGPGVPRIERDRVFERFHRVVDITRAGETDSELPAGSGLGLAICKAIVVSHGGDIGIEEADRRSASGDAGGTRIVVRLPGAQTTLVIPSAEHEVSE